MQYGTNDAYCVAAFDVAGQHSGIVTARIIESSEKLKHASKVRKLKSSKVPKVESSEG